MRPFPLSFPLLFTVAAAPLASQESPHPDSLRPPAVSNAEASVALAQATKLILFQLREALYAGDARSLMALVPDTVIPQDERVRSQDCRSLPNALVLADRLLGKGAPVHRYLVVNDSTAIQSMGGDTITAEATFLRTRSVPPKVLFTFVRREEALHLAGVCGLLDALCQAPAP